ncbi:hypothetical protein EUGRSUZ_C00913 [Eucalyptus grandis]|uniref:Uncharacterized protein n=2 Tax=Eucalyptus grandis TaxID=71139 RepID=A0ACC3LB96_EUCGR|nr:hypothetical protein EUGRSUZ_C00913 [Eucalyptus grandis]
MERGDPNVVAVARLRREDCERTKHDSAFATWKVLVGPTDWEDYSLGKEGAARYRVHNLPKSPGPGIYELGVAAPRAKLGREIAKLDLRYIVVVYLGKADCVRTRLQQYGRSGAHLGRCSSAACEIDCKTSCPTKQLGLFEEVLSRGYPIMFRWASLNNKGDAQRTELSLLNTFDYAWNKGSNGSRRPGDIFQKLDEIASSTYCISGIARKLLPIRPRQVGIRINGKLLSEKDSFPQTGGESSNSLNRIFKFSKSRPRLVISESHANDTAILGTSPANESFSPICGVVSEDGFPCTKPPVQGSKRCGEHKGMRLQASNSVLSRKGASNGIHDKPTVIIVISESHANDTVILGKCPSIESSPICGVVPEDGFPCTKPPVQGRKRCDEHKGMRIPVSDTVSSRRGASNGIHNNLTRTSWDHTAESRPRLVISESHANGTAISGTCPSIESSPICGVILKDGFPCTKPPVQGRKRCGEHKGMRIQASESVSSRRGASNGIHDKLTRTSWDHTAKIHELGNIVEVFPQQVDVKNNYGSVCGVDFGDGMFCTRRPVRGRVRCEHHKGMRVR